MKSNTTRFIKHFLIAILAFLSPFSLKAQIPAPPATANLEKQRLINEFIEVSRYKECLKNYAQFYIELKMFDYNTNPPKELLSEEQAKKVLSQFESLDIKSSLHSSFSFISEQNLKELIIFYKKIGGNLSKNNSIFLIDPILDLNIKNQLDYIIENINK